MYTLAFAISVNPYQRVRPHNLIKYCSHKLGGVVVERPLRMRKVAGSIPCRVIPNTIHTVVMAALLGAQGCGISIMTD